MIISYASGASRLVLILAAAAAAGSLSACDRNGPQTPDRVSAPQAAMALSAGPALPLTPAPPVQALPAAQPISIAEPPPATDDGYYYRYLDDADYMTDAFFDGPPDYTFDYGGVYPWAWRADDDALALVEPISGGYRYYYYHPGADYPFLVLDPDYAYGYNDGALITVFDSFGRVVPRFEYTQRAPFAARYLDRGRSLFQAARGPNRRAVTQAGWLQRRTQVAAVADRWRRDRERNPAWQTFRAQHAPQQQAMWAPERYRREASAARCFQRVNDPAASQHHWQQALQAQAVAGQPKTLPQRAGFRAFNAGGRDAAQPPAQPVRPQIDSRNPQEARQAERVVQMQTREAERAQAQARLQAQAQVQATRTGPRDAEAAARMQARQAQVAARAQQQGAQQAARAAQAQARQAEHAQAIAARANEHAADQASRVQARQAQMQARVQQQAAHAAQVQARQQAAQARHAAQHAAVIQPRPQPPARQAPPAQAHQGKQPHEGPDKDKHR